MSWSSRAGLALVLVAGLALAGCSGLRPVYDTGSVAATVPPVHYAAPGNRLERLVYQDLALKLGRSRDDGIDISVQVGEADRNPTSDLVTTAQAPRQVTLVANIRVVEDGKVLFAGQRRQTADYSVGPQVLANERARADAATRAAHLLADSVRLTVLGALAR